MILSAWVGTHRIDTQARKDGNLLGRGSYEVSGDATVLTATVSGVDGSGSSFEQVIVFDRR
jgi:hypothetical protein